MLMSLFLAPVSLSSRKWEWDECLIGGRAISEGVAEFLTRKLLRLPANVVAALRVISTFGSEVSMQVLTLVRDTCMNDDIIAQLEEPAKEGLIKMTEDTCSFVHDMIQQTVLQSINADEEARTLMELSGTLLARTEADREDSILFIAVDLINRVNPEGVPTDDRIRFANLLLIAGEKVRSTVF